MITQLAQFQNAAVGDEEKSGRDEDSLTNYIERLRRHWPRCVCAGRDCDRLVFRLLNLLVQLNPLYYKTPSSFPDCAARVRNKIVGNCCLFILFTTVKFFLTFSQSEPVTMFQVSRFGGFSNRPKGQGQDKINQLLNKLKKPEKDHREEAEERAAQDRDSISASESDSEQTSDDESSGDDSSEHDDGRVAEEQVVATNASESPQSRGASQSKQRHDDAGANGIDGINLRSTTLDIVRTMMGSAKNRSNVLRSMARVPATSAERALGAEQESAELARKAEAAKKAKQAQADTWSCLDTTLQKSAKSKGLKTWFPIQTQALPTIINALKPPGDKACGGDFCIAAPTGSGKTLAYVLPVLQTLLNRRVIRLRALIILPTRDLAMQVYGVFKAWAKTTDLKIGLVRGQAPFRAEQEMLVGSSDVFSTNGSLNTASGTCRVDILIATPGRLIDHLEQTPGFSLEHLRILVIDEVDRLTRQSYQQWLAKVNDNVHAAHKRHSSPSVPPASRTDSDRALAGRGLLGRWSNTGSSVCAQLGYADMELLSVPVATVHRPTAGFAWVPFTRILVSATLTTNPQRLEEMQLRRPTVFSLTTPPGNTSTRKRKAGSTNGSTGHDGADDGHKYVRVKNKMKKMFATPASLSEHMVLCRTGAERPLALLHLLNGQWNSRACNTPPRPCWNLLFFLLLNCVVAMCATEQVTKKGLQTIIFCSSVESTHRLARLLEIYGGFPGDGVYEFSRTVSQNRRNEMIKGFRARKCLVLVASDSMARGMDMVECKVRRNHGVRASALQIGAIIYACVIKQLVINYDAPVYVKTYIHRAGAC